MDEKGTELRRGLDWQGAGRRDRAGGQAVWIPDRPDCVADVQPAPGAGGASATRARLTVAWRMQFPDRFALAARTPTPRGPFF